MRPVGAGNQPPDCGRDGVTPEVALTNTDVGEERGFSLGKLDLEYELCRPWSMIAFGSPAYSQITR
jgi:hypothetical protein